MSAGIKDQLQSGQLALLGHYDEDAVTHAVDLASRVEADGIETVRLLFPDQHGILRGKTITARALPAALACGIGLPSTLLLKDTSHRTVFPIWGRELSVGDVPLAGASDMICAPDPHSYRRLPWSPHSAVILCDLLQRTGSPISFASRDVLRQAEAQLAMIDRRAVFGLEIEFNVFERVDGALDHHHATMPPAPVETRNTTQGYQFLTATRYGEVEDMLDHLRRNAEALGLSPRTIEIEMGPSQFEFTFDPSGPSDQADKFVLFRMMVKEICHSRGLHASFMAKPKLPNAAANGWHIHQSILDQASAENLFVPDLAGEVTDTAQHWIAGLLHNAAASCLMTAPTVTGYKRFTSHQLAPNAVQWGTDNRGAMVRALLYPNDQSSRLENRVAESAANPYFAFAAQILSGLDGLKRRRPAPAPTETPYGDDGSALPQNLGQAIQAFATSPLYRDALGSDFVDYLVRIKRAEWQRYLSTVSEWEQAEYFNLF